MSNNTTPSDNAGNMSNEKKNTTSTEKPTAPPRPAWHGWLFIILGLPLTALDIFGLISVLEMSRKFEQDVNGVSMLIGGAIAFFGLRSLYTGIKVLAFHHGAKKSKSEAIQTS